MGRKTALSVCALKVLLKSDQGRYLPFKMLVEDDQLIFFPVFNSDVQTIRHDLRSLQVSSTDLESGKASLCQ